MWIFLVGVDGLVYLIASIYGVRSAAKSATSDFITFYFNYLEMLLMRLKSFRKKGISPACGKRPASLDAKSKQIKLPAMEHPSGKQLHLQKEIVARFSLEDRSTIWAWSAPVHGKYQSEPDHQISDKEIREILPKPP